eukprot:Colp12_sorted_trinity150504_noHs@25691
METPEHDNKMASSTFQFDTDVLFGNFNAPAVESSSEEVDERNVHVQPESSSSSDSEDGAEGVHKPKRQRLDKDEASSEHNASLASSYNVLNKGSTPLAEIVYYNNKLSLALREKIETFIQSLVAQPEDTIDSSGESQGRVIYYSDMSIDKTQVSLLMNNTSVSEHYQPPKYEQIFYHPLPLDSDVKLSMPKRRCFNCNGTDHVLSDCPQEINREAVAAARKEFDDENANKPNLRGRYHADEEDEARARFAHIKPGVWSERFRKALGIREHEIPMFVRRMSTLGYPPGWLRRADLETDLPDEQFEPSGINIIDHSAGKVSSCETSDERHSKQFVSAVKFPGFNAPVDYVPPKEVHVSSVVDRVDMDMDSDEEGRESDEAADKIAVVESDSDEVQIIEVKEASTTCTAEETPVKHKWTNASLHDEEEAAVSPERWIALQKLLAQRQGRS